MKRIGEWHVGEIGGAQRRAFTRKASGECFSVTQARGGGAFVVVRFKCPDEVYQRILQSGGEFADQDAGGIEVLDAVEVPDGLVDALLA